VTTPVIDPVNGYNTGFTATPAIAFGNSLCFNHGMPSRRGQQGNLERICLSVFYSTRILHYWQFIAIPSQGNRTRFLTKENTFRNNRQKLSNDYI
jgi:hypothetical protein